LVRTALAVGVALMIWPSSACAQPLAAAETTAAALPEPIYWRQNLFLIPYQWSAAADPGEAQSVWLYVSKDRGATWQKISEARPQVRAFNYHAEADGDYWFAIRTTDAGGSFWPPGPIEPEIRVIVDTTIPRFETLSGILRDDGTLDVQWRVLDANIDCQAWQVDVQTDSHGDWQVVPQPHWTPLGLGITAGHATTQMQLGGSALAVRVAATDLAGNRAVSQANVSPRPISRVAGDGWPTIVSGRSDDQPPAGYDPATDDHDAGDDSGWVASRPTAGESHTNSPATPTAAATANLPWPADNRNPTPSYLLTGPSSPPADAAPIAGTDSADRASGKVASEFASFGGPAGERRSPFMPLEPFRERAAKPWESASDAAGSAAPAGPSAAAAGELDPWLWLSGPEVTLPRDITPKLVNSRTFVLEYELEDVGPWGVAKVELWGTRDGGRTWRNYATDDDHASPMHVTVGEAGLYGFRIVVSAGGGVGGFPPQPGERPELWVGVDLHRPEIELTGAEPGSGELAGHLLLRWWADDDNLERRPIGLFYSSRPVGPWTAIATNLANTGEYPWRLERHLPPRVHLRLEARDTAGNLAAYQTYEPVSIELPPPSGRIQSVGSMERPMQWSSSESVR
jgi:hypothetical protein